MSKKKLAVAPMTIKQVLAGLAVAAAVVGCRTAGPGDYSVSVMSSGTPRLVWYDGTLLYSVNSDGSTNAVPGLAAETDPTVSNFIKAITSTQIGNWDTSFSWGDHADGGYGSTQSIASLEAGTSNWNTAFSWGDHSGLYKDYAWVPGWDDVTNKPALAHIGSNNVFAAGTTQTMERLEIGAGGEWTNTITPGTISMLPYSAMGLGSEQKIFDFPGKDLYLGRSDVTFEHYLRFEGVVRGADAVGDTDFVTKQQTDGFLDEAAADLRYGQLEANNNWTMTNTFSEVIVSNGFTIGGERRTTWPTGGTGAVSYAVGNLAHLTTNQATANGWTWTDNGTVVSILAYDYTKGGVHVTIPDTIDGLPVTEMQDSAIFATNSWLKSVTGASNLSTTEPMFYSATNLESVELIGATNIANYAFVGCVSLISVSAPNAIRVGVNAFTSCSGLTEVNLPKAVYVGETAFEDAFAVGATLSLPLLEIADTAAFVGARFARVYLPSATNLVNTALANNTNLVGVYFGATIPTVSELLYGLSTNVVTYYPAGATAWLALDPQEWPTTGDDKRPIAMVDTHATTLSSVALGRKDLDEIWANSEDSASVTPYAIAYAATVTVSRANGAWQSYRPTNTTTIAIADGGTGTVDSVRLDLWAGTNTITFATNNVTYADFAVATNAATALLYDSKLWHTNWSGFVLELP